MFCKRDNLKPCQNITTELSKTKTTLSLRDVSEDAHIFNAVRAVLKCKQNRISRLEICGGLCTKKKKEFLSLLREIKHLSALCLVCHRLGPDMTRDLIRYVVEETKIRDLEISFDSTRCGISQGCSSWVARCRLRGVVVGHEVHVVDQAFRRAMRRWLSSISS